MSHSLPARQEALDLLRQYSPSDKALKHALAVEAVMRHFARRGGQDPQTWGLVGLIHDLDYEAFPDQHCRKTPELLRQHGWPEELIRAAVSHGWGICSDVQPQSDLEKVLYAVDELTGLVAATALVRPSRSVMDLEASSVLKKWKDKRFAAGVDRSVIQQGADRLGVDLKDLVSDVIAGMREAAGELGLGGPDAPPAER